MCRFANVAIVAFLATQVTGGVHDAISQNNNHEESQAIVLILSLPMLSGKHSTFTAGKKPNCDALSFGAN